jgi:dephospho-CoA kinase
MTGGKPYIVGLTGGIASGKSHVARALVMAGRELGVAGRVIDSDVLAAEAWEDKGCRAVLTSLLGEAVVPPLPGRVDRGAVAAAIFGNEALRKRVEAVIHPYVAGRRQQLLAEGGVGLFVLDSPLLLESGLGASCDAVVFVDTPEAVRRQRAAARGWSEEALASREAAQWPMDRKRFHANHYIKGTYGDVELRAACRDLLEVLGLRGRGAGRD